MMKGMDSILTIAVKLLKSRRNERNSIRK
jgi:hypothetical protein